MRDIGRYLEIKALVKSILPRVTITQGSDCDTDEYVITGSGRHGTFTKLEYEVLSLGGFYPYQDTCQLTGDEIEDCVEALLQPCKE